MNAFRELLFEAFNDNWRNSVVRFLFGSEWTTSKRKISKSFVSFFENETKNPALQICLLVIRHTGEV